LAGRAAEGDGNVKRFHIKSNAGVEMAYGDRKILGLNDLHQAAIEKRAVHCPRFGNWKTPKPAAFMLNLSGSILRRMLNSGMYVYPRKDEIHD
jgi:hypothetical protein